MLCRELTEVIEETFPKTAACSWDNVGLLAGRNDKKVEKVYVALDATDEVIAHAKEWGADLLVTHHPLLFAPAKCVTDGDFIGRRLLSLIRQDISYYAMHTNYDVMHMGEAAAVRLGITKRRPLEVTFQTVADAEEGSVEEACNQQEKGIGCIGIFETGMSLKDCALLVKERFTLPDVRVFGAPEANVKKIAVVPGSGKDEISEALRKGADVLVTGDIGHHDGIDAAAQGLAVIDAGHYGLEHIFMEEMELFFREKFPMLQVKTEAIAHPFWVL